jgi:hypothetical protein
MAKPSIAAARALHPRLRIPLVSGQDTLLFPAIRKDAQDSAPVARVSTGTESTCYFHPHKAAESPCSACGRFVCALCALPWDGSIRCPDCLSTPAAKGDDSDLKLSRRRYDLFAFQLAVISFVPPFLYVSFLTLPAVITLAVLSSRRKPVAMPVLSNLKWVWAILFAILATAIWVGIIVAIALA